MRKIKRIDRRCLLKSESEKIINIRYKQNIDPTLENLLASKNEKKFADKFNWYVEKRLKAKECYKINNLLIDFSIAETTFVSIYKQKYKILFR